MYAVIRTGGKQYRVRQNDILRIEFLNVEPGAEVKFDVLAIGEGADLKIGKPLVDSASVVGTVLRHARARKVIIYKFQRRQNYHRKKGHRQAYTEIRISDIKQ
ncbi:MAG: 50S ribosomal protein L21 [Bradymonadia bacterium]